MNAIVLREVKPEAPWAWLSGGWADVCKAPVASLGYGLIFVVVGIAITGGLWYVGLSSMIPVAVSGFALVAPALAVGLYRVSRRLERARAGEAGEVGVPEGARTQIALLSVLLLVLLTVWGHLAQFLFAYFIHGDYPSLADFTSYILSDPSGLLLLFVGTLVGAFLALVAFAISALSFPMLVDQPVDVVTAITTSVRAVREQPFVMLLWAWIVAFVTTLGAAFFVVGLAIAFPLLAHATWRSYRAFFPSD